MGGRAGGPFVQPRVFVGPSPPPPPLPLPLHAHTYFSFVFLNKAGKKQSQPRDVVERHLVFPSLSQSRGFLFVNTPTFSVGGGAHGCLRGYCSWRPQTSSSASPHPFIHPFILCLPTYMYSCICMFLNLYQCLCMYIYIYMSIHAYIHYVLM